MRVHHAATHFIADGSAAAPHITIYPYYGLAPARLYILLVFWRSILGVMHHYTSCHPSPSQDIVHHCIYGSRSTFFLGEVVLLETLCIFCVLFLGWREGFFSRCHVIIPGTVASRLRYSKPLGSSRTLLRVGVSQKEGQARRSRRRRRRRRRTEALGFLFLVRRKTLC